jgi:hypothetical protein
LREEHRLRILENRVLRTIFGPKTDEVKGEWRKLHNETWLIQFNFIHVPLMCWMFLNFYAIMDTKAHYLYL